MGSFSRVGADRVGYQESSNTPGFVQTRASLASFPNPFRDFLVFKQQHVRNVDVSKATRHPSTLQLCSLIDFLNS